MDENPYRAPREKGARQVKVNRPSLRALVTAIGAALMIGQGVSGMVFVALGPFWNRIVTPIAMAGIALFVFRSLVRRNKPTQS